jgi:ligand-binding SRPBCC domain-containing protein
MAYYRLRFQQQLNASMEEAWEFMVSPKNLQKITPPSMGFEITTPTPPSEIHAGMTIGYYVPPLLGIKMAWLTEITHLVPLQFFVDEQRYGPYKMWHHQHHIRKHNQGVLMEDILTYQLPFGILGSLANALFVRKKIQHIFHYRHEALNRLFSSKNDEKRSD